MTNKKCECRCRRYIKARNFGKNMIAFNNFINNCEENKSIEYHHPEYVAMSRKRYEDIMSEKRHRDIMAKFNPNKVNLLKDECADVDDNMFNY